jgi:hypothetical protein
METNISVHMPWGNLMERASILGPMETATKGHSKKARDQARGC